MSYQVFLLSGRLTRDPILRDVGQTQVANFSIATSRKYKDKNGELVEEVLFMDTAVWGTQAKSCAEYLSKGSQVLAQGYLKQEEYNDSSTGAPKSKIILQADKVVFMGSKKDDKDVQAPMPFNKNGGLKAVCINEFLAMDLPNKNREHIERMDPNTGQGELDLKDMNLPF